MSRSISIVGAGRVGKTLGKCLRRRGWRVEAVVERSEAHARTAVRWIGGGKPYGRLTHDIFVADLILLTVPDTAIGKVASQLARLTGAGLRGAIVLHASGALDRSVLAPLARRGAATGSIHPMQTFTGKEPPKLKGAIFAVEGDAGARRVARAIARELGGTAILIDSIHKPAYHMAGTLVAGHGLALVEAATQILMKIGFTRRRALQALLPLFRQMIDNFEAVGPRRAWTGPIARGDYSVVAGHAKALRRFPREFADAYASLAFLGGRLLAKDSSTAIAHLRRALK